MINCMHDHVFLNGRIIPASDAALPALSNAALYGKGVFTTVAIYDGRPLHWRRIEGNTTAILIDLSGYSEETMQNAVAELIEANLVTNGRARITFFDASEGKIWNSNATKKTSLLIVTGELRQVPDNFRLTISPYAVNSRSPLAGLKTCNYLEKMLALDEAKRRGFDEAIQLNEHGEITSAVMANVFWLKDDFLYTPNLSTGCLPGTTREFVIENFECREVERGIDDLHSADAIFLTSAGLGAVQVAEFESRRFDRSDHEILKLISNRTGG